ncbi:MAG: hypothetical protein ACXAE3_16295 [Candidatus Kariarchaeaceae archaeon]
MADLESIASSIHTQIKREEGVGDQAGGSGHLGFVSIMLGNVEIMKKDVDQSHGYMYKVRTQYTKFIESEFSIEPDNPPHEYIYSQIFFLDNEYTIVGFDAKQLLKSNVDISEFIDFEPEE